MTDPELRELQQRVAATVARSVSVLLESLQIAWSTHTRVVIDAESGTVWIGHRLVPGVDYQVEAVVAFDPRDAATFGAPLTLLPGPERVQ